MSDTANTVNAHGETLRTTARQPAVSRSLYSPLLAGSGPHLFSGCRAKFDGRCGDHALGSYETIAAYHKFSDKIPDASPGAFSLFENATGISFIAEPIGMALRPSVHYVRGP
jgi:hypothetical protein